MKSLFVLVCTSILLVSCDKLPSKSPQADYQKDSDVFSLSGHTMGTTYSIKYFLPDPSKLNDASVLQVISEQSVQKDIQARLDQVESLMSTYRPDSELMRFNRQPVGQAFEMSQLTYDVFAIANKIHQQSLGAFDATVGPLVSLWGFTRSETHWQPPAQAQIDAVLEQIGQDALSFQVLETSPTLEPSDGEPLLSSQFLAFRNRPVEVDLSAVAKGYGVDRVVSYFREVGIDRFMVEVGGEVAMGKPKPSSELWRIAIERPEVGVRAVHRVLSLKNIAVATSGNYRNFMQYQGHRYGHTLDPKTGRPVDHNLASVTVLVPLATEPSEPDHRPEGEVKFPTALADGWATALLVAGPDAGKMLARKYHLAVIFLIATPTGMEQWVSPEGLNYLDEK